MSFWTAALGGELRYIDAGGLRTRTLTLGSGRPLVLLHGRGGHLETFMRNQAVLAEHFRTIAIDLAGHGLTARTADGRYDIGALSAHFIACLDALAIDRTDVLGQSLGGWVAVWAALGAPERVQRLALIEPAGLQAETERLSDTRVAERYASGGEAYKNPSREAVRKRLAGLLADPGAVDPEMIETRWHLYQPPEAREVHERVRAADNAPFLLTRERWAALTQPVLFINGVEGHTPRAVLESAAAACRNARLLEVPGARQWPQFESPATVNQAVREFLST